MPFNNRLLVILRAGAQLQPALVRARLIASRLATQIHLIADVLALKPEGYEEVFHMLLEHSDTDPPLPKEVIGG